MLRFVKMFILLMLILLASISYAVECIDVIYLRPTNAPEVEDKFLDDLRNELKKVQSFYASEMNRFGYGSKTFRYKLHKNGKIFINVVEGTKTNIEYRNSANVIADLPEFFELQFLVPKLNEIEVETYIRIILKGGPLRDVNLAVGQREEFRNFFLYTMFIDVNIEHKNQVPHILAYLMGKAFQVPCNNVENSIMYCAGGYPDDNVGDKLIGIHSLLEDETKLLSQHRCFEVIKGLSVQLKDNLTTLWGQVKQR